LASKYGNGAPAADRPAAGAPTKHGSWPERIEAPVNAGSSNSVIARALITGAKLSEQSLERT